MRRTRWVPPLWKGRSCGHAGCHPRCRCRLPDDWYSVELAGNPELWSWAYILSRNEGPGSLLPPDRHSRRCLWWKGQTSIHLWRRKTDTDTNYYKNKKKNVFSKIWGTTVTISHWKTNTTSYIWYKNSLPWFDFKSIKSLKENPSRWGLKYVFDKHDLEIGSIIQRLCMACLCRLG